MDYSPPGCSVHRVIPGKNTGVVEKEMATHSSILAWDNPMDWGAWWAVIQGVANSWTHLSSLSLSLSHTHTHTPVSNITCYFLGEAFFCFFLNLMEICLSCWNFSQLLVLLFLPIYHRLHICIYLCIFLFKNFYYLFWAVLDLCCFAWLPTVVASPVAERGLWRAWASATVLNGFSCPVAFGIVPGQGLNQCLLQWQLES